MPGDLYLCTVTPRNPGTTDAEVSAYELIDDGVFVKVPGHLCRCLFGPHGDDEALATAASTDVFDPSAHDVSCSWWMMAGPCECRGGT